MRSPAKRANGNIAAWMGLTGTFLAGVAQAINAPWLMLLAPGLTAFIVWYAPFVQMRLLVWHYNKMIGRLTLQLQQASLPAVMKKELQERLRESKRMLFELQIALLPGQEEPSKELVRARKVLNLTLAAPPEEEPDDEEPDEGEPVKNDLK